VKVPPLPSGLQQLVHTYAHTDPESARYRPTSWAAHLDESDVRWLTDPSLTKPSLTHESDRLLHADEIEHACARLDLGNNVELRRAFVLVMAWGSGTSMAGRSYRNTAAALEDDDRLVHSLRQTAALCRGDGACPEVCGISVTIPTSFRQRDRTPWV
jgi:hypothetical protein